MHALWCAQVFCQLAGLSIKMKCATLKCISQRYQWDIPWAPKHVLASSLLKNMTKLHFCLLCHKNGGGNKQNRKQIGMCQNFLLESTKFLPSLASCSHFTIYFHLLFLSECYMHSTQGQHQNSTGTPFEIKKKEKRGIMVYLEGTTSYFW